MDEGVAALFDMISNRNMLYTLSFIPGPYHTRTGPTMSLQALVDNLGRCVDRKELIGRALQHIGGADEAVCVVFRHVGGRDVTTSAYNLHPFHRMLCVASHEIIMKAAPENALVVMDRDDADLRCHYDVDEDYEDRFGLAGWQGPRDDDDSC